MGDSWAWAGYLYEEDEMVFEGPFGPMPWVGPQPVSDEDDHNVAKAMKAAHEDMDKKFQPGGNVQPLGTSTSQADVMMSKASEPHMYSSTLYPNDTTPVVWAEHLSPTSGRLEIEKIPNEQAMRVVMDVLPKVLELYLKKSRDYGGNVMQLMDLGPKACIPDMLRKFGKLKRAVWDGEEMVGEQPDEIIMDLAGHIFIILDEMWNK